MSMHFTKLENSEQLQRVWKLLRERGDEGVTTWEILQNTLVLNPATMISHLRKNGLDICCHYMGRNNDGRRVYRYYLRAKPEAV